MLESLSVKNLALIEKAEITFGNGLNILSGETGAGKSIVIGSVNIALGGRVPKGIIRHNAEYAYIELVFSIEEEVLKKKLEESDVFLEEGQLIIARKLTETRSICKVNGETVPASKVKKIANLLMDIHGQHEHQSLLYPSKHLEILDTYAKSQLQSWKIKNQQQFKRWQSIKKELDGYYMNEEERRRELSFLEFEIQDIENAALVSGEEEELTADYRRLVHNKQILEGLSEVSASLGYDSPQSAGELVGRSVKIIQQLCEYDENLGKISDELFDLEALLGDINREVASAFADRDLDEEALNQIQARLDLIHSMKRKYGQTIERIQQYLEEKKAEYTRLIHFNERKAELEKELEIIKLELIEITSNMTKIRHEAAKKLENVMKESLIDLNFLDVRFNIEVRALDHFTVDGVDEAEFLISTNPGEEIRPLRAVASGGELSRIMLAIKSVLADSDDTMTLIFDEIDTGISGRTAQKVSEKLSFISCAHQVICISHLAQIVAMADRHFLIEKRVENQNTITNIHCLNKSESVKELARLLGGTQITEKTMETAEEMKELANSTKEN